MYILFSIMSKEKENQKEAVKVNATKKANTTKPVVIEKKGITLKEVMPSVKQLLFSNYAEEPKETANVVQEMFECLMCTPYGDTQSFREQALLAVVALREAAPIVDAMALEYKNLANV